MFKVSYLFSHFQCSTYEFISSIISSASENPHTFQQISNKEEKKDYESKERRRERNNEREKRKKEQRPQSTQPSLHPANNKLIERKEKKSSVLSTHSHRSTLLITN